MLKDVQGLIVTTDSPQAIAAINRFIDQALGYGKDAETAILQAIEADSTCALAYAYAGAYYLSQENKKAWQQAQPYLQVAQRYLNQITEREQLYVQGILAWANKEIDVAIALHEQITNQFPRDLISVQQGQYHYFYTGEQEKLLKIAQKVLPHNPQQHYLYGMVAFGLEQCHQLKAAEKMARQAIALNRNDPWAHHAISHVMETQGRVNEGIAWMESFADTWENCNSWQRANKQSPKDQVGAISILLRLELQGVNVGDRWQSISPYLYSRIDEHALPFQDLHYIYALAKAGHNHEVKQMLHSMQYHALSINPFLRRSWLEVAIPAAKAMVAHAQGDFQTTVTQLQLVLPHLHEIGGSHAQRVLFEQVYHDAVLNAQKPSLIYCVSA
jgi:tetratricopeptide (TPR) repeat protein